MDWDTIADTFSLGAVMDVPKVVAEGWGGHNRVWRVVAENGTFAVKESRRPIGDEILSAIEIERAAVAGGIAAPAPIAAVDGRWVVRVDDVVYRCHDWVEGRAKRNEDADATDAKRMGQLVARLHDLALPTMPPEPAVRFGAGHWSELAAKAPETGWASLVRDHLNEIVATEDAVPETEGHCVGSHRDLNAHNVLFGDERLVLIDWDAAGPALPAKERAEYAVIWAHTDSGRLDLDIATAFLRGYSDAGGHVDSSDADALRGRLAGLVWWAEQNVQLALRGVGDNQDELAALLVFAVIDGRRVVKDHERFLADAIAHM